MSLRSVPGSTFGYALLGLTYLFVIFTGYLTTASTLTNATAGRAVFVVLGLGATATTGFPTTRGGR